MGQYYNPKPVKTENVKFLMDVRNSFSRFNYADLINNFIGTATGATSSGIGISLGVLFSALTDKIDFSNLTSLNFVTTPISIVAWIYPISYGGGSQGRIVDKFKTTFPQTGYALWIDNTIGVSSLRFGTGFTVSTTIATINNSITLNTWQHVAVTYAGTSCTFYVNGSSIGSSGNITNPSSGSNSLIIGNNSSGTNNFDGKIDFVKIFDTALTSRDIYDIYNSTKSRYGL
jgi:hypothetical protein